MFCFVAVVIDDNSAELMEKFDELDALFKDFCAEENRGNEKLVDQYERMINKRIQSTRARPIFATE